MDDTEMTPVPLTNVEPSADTTDTNELNADAAAIEKDLRPETLRVQLQNLPRYCTSRDVKKLLERAELGQSSRKIRVLKQHAFVSFSTKDAFEKAVTVLNGQKLKGCLLSVRPCAEESRGKADRSAEANENTEDVSEQSLPDRVTPWWNVPYEEQLERKQEASMKLLRHIGKQLAGLAPSLMAELLMPIRASPVHAAYRNKCEFSIGKSSKDELTVGFVAGKFGGSVESPLECQNMPEMTKRICAAFQDYVAKSHLPPYDEITHKGFWRMVTVRNFAFDVMLIITVNRRYFEEELTIETTNDIAEERKTLENNVKTDIIARFLRENQLEVENYRVTSLYYATADKMSDGVNYEHLGGAPFVYETILGKRFRVSPDAFFQTNSAATNVLYSTATELLHLDSETLLLDLCCGTGTIGICLADKCKAVLGIEMVASAVNDARRNAAENQLSPSKCRFVCGKVEDVFAQLRYYLPSCCCTGVSDGRAALAALGHISAVIDPPRGGVHSKLINPLRMLGKLRSLVYISCDPRAASKNFIDLCRPSSKAFPSEPFRLVSVTPVDMFPQTALCEWVLLFQR